MINFLLQEESIVPEEVLKFDFQKFFTRDIPDWLLYKGVIVLVGILIIILGFFLTKYVVGFFKRAMRKSNLDESLISFLASILSIGIKVLIVVLVAAMIGMETSAFVAVVGAAGLAIGLALQGSLSNFAGGVLILIFKPFRVGEIIRVRDEEGVVEHIDILNTRIRKYNHEMVIAPNGELANSMLVNLSEADFRRVQIPVRISYDSDVQKAREICLKVFKEHSQTVEDPPPVVWMNKMEPSYVSLTARCWCSMDDFWPVYWECTERIKEEFDKTDAIHIPVPQRDLYLKEHPAMENEAGDTDNS